MPTSVQSDMRTLSSIGTGRITLTKGVPARNGMFRRGVMDGPNGSFIDMAQDWEPVEKGGQWATLRCTDDVEFGHPRCGEYKQVFMFTIPVQPNTYTIKTIPCGE